MAEQGQGADVAPGHEHLTDADVARIETVVRRVVRARVRDDASADDLTQEAMTRLLERDTAAIRDVEQYAATVALNLVRSRWAADARDRAARSEVIDLRDSVVPDDAVADADVAAAMRDALAELEPDKRDALVAHEVEGVPTADLADDGTSPGAVAASLARTRSRLRVGFVLRYRRVDLPDGRCRPVLEAISAHDTRRQQRLGVSAHLEGCATCRDLAPVLRDRGVAWLGLSPGFAALLRRRDVQAGAAAVAVAAAVAAVALVRADDADTPRPPVEAATNVPATPSTPQAEPPPSPPSSAEPRQPSPAGQPAADPPPPGATEATTAGDPPPDRSEPPARTPPPAAPVEAPTVHLPADLPVVGEDLVLDHPVIEPLEPVVCPALELPVPIVSCESDEPSDLDRAGP